MNIYASTSIRCLVALLISALLLASCSGTNESDASAISLPTNTAAPVSDINDIAVDADSPASENELDDDPIGSDDSTTADNNQVEPPTEG